MSRKYIIKSGDRYYGEDGLFHYEKSKAKTFQSKGYPRKLRSKKLGGSSGEMEEMWWRSEVVTQ